MSCGRDKEEHQAPAGDAKETVDAGSHVEVSEKKCKQDLRKKTKTIEGYYERVRRQLQIKVCVMIISFSVLG